MSFSHQFMWCHASSRDYVRVACQNNMAEAQQQAWRQIFIKKKQQQRNVNVLNLQCIFATLFPQFVLWFEFIYIIDCFDQVVFIKTWLK